jgi:hypothetical protein
MINFRVALHVVTAGSIRHCSRLSSGGYFVTLMQTNCGGAPPWPLRGSGQGYSPTSREENSEALFLAREKGN